MWKWLSTVAVVAIIIVLVARYEHYAGQQYEADRQADCIRLAITPEKQSTCRKEAQDRHKYAPWGYELVAWPLGIETWALIVTLAAIAWQADETRQ